MTTTKKSDWRNVFTLDAPRYVRVSDDYETFCAPVPEEANLTEVVTQFASIYCFAWTAPGWHTIRRLLRLSRG